MSTTRTLKSEAQTKAHVANAVLSLVLFSVVALFLPAASPTWWKVLVISVGVILAGQSLYMASTLGVTPTATGVIVRNPFSRHVVPWNEVANFELMNTWPFTAVLRKTDGTALKLWAIAGKRQLRPEAQSLVDQLNALRR
jgi:hypothetical protein